MSTSASGPRGRIEFTAEEASAMRRALELARRGEGRTAPNPPVGAVIVRDERVVGEGYHARVGDAHAEVIALRDAGEMARGATMFVTLEPCSFHGRTPPCADALVNAGIKRVHVAVIDPNPRVSSRGIEQLRAAGIEVTTGLEHAAARSLIAPFAHHIRVGRPHVTAKYAMTLDGRIATRGGDSRWVSGEASRRKAHALRDATDAILVGAGTVLADDPSLTTRHPDVERDAPHRHPLRVILDSHGRLPLTARVFGQALPGETIVATVDAPDVYMAERADRGVEVLRLPDDGAGRVSLPHLLDILGDRGVMGLLVEGGAEVLGAFFDQSLVQRCIVFIAPKIIGGTEAPGPVGGVGNAMMADAVNSSHTTSERLGDDTMITAELIDTEAAIGSRTGAASELVVGSAASGMLVKQPTSGGGN